MLVDVVGPYVLPDASAEADSVISYLPVARFSYAGATSSTPSRLHRNGVPSIHRVGRNFTVRAAIQRSKVSIQKLSERHGVNPKTVGSPRSLTVAYEVGADENPRRLAHRCRSWLPGVEEAGMEAKDEDRIADEDANCPRYLGGRKCRTYSPDPG